MTKTEHEAWLAENDRRMARIDTILSEARSEHQSVWGEILTHPYPLPLPAPSLTEDAIVAALKADPGMAGRVMAVVAWKTSHDGRAEMGRSARAFVDEGSGITLRGTALQSLAVALAAASYRG